jgi:two-component system chemotaxis response regulator CheB
VDLITENLLIEPNHVYIIPANRDLHVDGEVFQLRPISKPRGWPDVITVFLKSLTQYWGGKLIAVIVSGFDGDGAAALRGIKEVGGITIAQKSDTVGVSPTCPKAPLTAAALILSCRPKTLPKKLCALRRRRPEDLSDWISGKA